jgi:sRNA-binding protein
MMTIEPKLLRPFAELPGERVPPVQLGPPVSLAIDIHEQFAAMLPAGCLQKLYYALAAHTSGGGYLAAMLSDHPRLRFDAEGNIAGEVDNASRLHADTKLRAKMARDAARAANGALNDKPKAHITRLAHQRAFWQPYARLRDAARPTLTLVSLGARR